MIDNEINDIDRCVRQIEDMKARMVGALSRGNVDAEVRWIANQIHESNQRIKRSLTTIKQKMARR